MAAHMISSALTTLLINEPFTHHLLRHNLHRTIQQRRKTRGIIYTSFELYSSSWPLKTDHRKTLVTDRLSSPLCHFSHSYISEGGELYTYRRDSCLSHPKRTLRWCERQRQTRSLTSSVASWEAVKEEKKTIREAGQDLLFDLKERRAKVREKVDEIIERENIWTVPNLLCVSRIAFSPVLVHLVVSSNYSWALGLFMLAGFTDLLDGWIARTFPGQASNLGSFLDPLADKVLVALLFLSLTYVGLIPLPLTGLIIYRDVLIIGGASYVRYKSLPPPRTVTRYFDATHATAKLAPTTLSKVNTAIQLSLITASLAAPVFCFTDHYLLKAIWWVTAATTLSSGISYIFSRDTYKILSNMNKSPQK
ncbi:cardiolipin synthase (CMP-forming)-like isoform X3 [Homarus americanus]|uniref:cardiolipin synthase (CMP-forming)-like isoform X3 n=1 Tax=Homarus americanus TaxID=6706 RepID=UPI001C466631|nr:cardiolipin synthase (CMP-forming)-like isoform X3 [Homarus americanus]